MPEYNFAVHPVANSVALYASLDSGAVPGDALRAGKLQLLDGNSRFSHPYWAPFEVFVGPGSR